MEIWVIFHEPESEENVGAIARVCKNFGVKNLILINPKCKISEKAYIVAKHGRDVLENAIILNKLEEALKMFDLNIGTTGLISDVRNVFRNPITPEELSKKIEEYDGKVGLYIGRESIGFTNKELRKFDILVTIPANPEYPILNASHACAVILYELYKRKRNIVREKYTLASREIKDTIYKLIDEVVNKLVKEDFRRERMKRVLELLVNKSLLTEREATIFTGFLRRILEEL